MRGVHLRQQGDVGQVGAHNTSLGTATAVGVPHLQDPLQELTDSRFTLKGELRLPGALKKPLLLLDAQSFGFLHLECHSPEGSALLALRAHLALEEYPI